MPEILNSETPLHLPVGTPFETLEVGQTFHSAYLVSDDVSHHFLSAFKDTHPIHVDESFAKARGFKSRVVHGAILHGFLSHFVGCGLAHPECMLLSSDLAFSSPVYLGDSIELRAMVTSFSQAVRVAELSIEFLRTQDSKRVAIGKIRVRWGTPK